MGWVLNGVLYFVGMELSGGVMWDEERTTGWILVHEWCLVSITASGPPPKRARAPPTAPAAVATATVSASSSDTDEESCEKLNTDVAPPERSMPHTEAEEPIRTEWRRDSEEPQEDWDSTDMEEPR